MNENESEDGDEITGGVGTSSAVFCLKTPKLFCVNSFNSSIGFEEKLGKFNYSRSTDSNLYLGFFR